jgi:hypothetical protein
MNPEDLGKIITSDQSKDAIHIAIAPVMATCLLRPGAGVALVWGTDDQAIKSETPIGIVDPFLKECVSKGERFWMFLLPGSIQGLRHEWTHPAFGTAVAAKMETELLHGESRRALEAEADSAGIGYDELMEAASNYLDNGEYLSDGGRWEGHSVGRDFWDHFEKMTGRRVPNDERGDFFSCSC